MLNIYDFLRAKKMHNAYSITAAITALFMHETINDRGISDEKVIYIDEWHGIVFLFVLFFSKKVGHFDLNDATPQHPF